MTYGSPGRLVVVLALVLACGVAQALPAPEIRIGVLSHRGDAATERMWAPTAEYLTDALPPNRFRIEPLPFEEVDAAVAARRVDFVLVNPAIYVNLEVRHRISRIATMRNRIDGVELNLFGGVIFTRADRPDIQTLEDLAGRSLTAVDPTSLGGFEMAWGELLEKGIDPYEDLASLRFAGIHDAVVLAVLRGETEAGTVRTDILERMAASGAIDMADFRILNQRFTPDFPFVHSTPLFPEWPFSKVQHTDNHLAQRVAVALLQMPSDHPAAQAGSYAGWTVPLDYQPVHRLLETLRLPPYDQVARFTLADAIERYWFGFLLGSLSLLVMTTLTAWVTRLNQRLARAKARLEQQHELILNSVGEGICGVDLQGRTTFVNRAMEEITGWSAEELIGHDQHSLLHHTRGDGSRHPPEQCPVYLTFHDSQPRFVDDDLFWRKDGTSFPVEYSSNPIRDERGATLGSVVVFRNVTERKEAARRQLELAHVGRLSTLGEMASGIAHELNQPLTAISTNARACVRMLESGRTSIEHCSDVMERIADQAERAGEVIRQIRHFVRKEEPVFRRARVSDMIETVLGLIRPDARRAGVLIELTIADDADQVLAQDIQIEQVMLNLVRNAIEAMAETPPQARRLEIESRRLADGRVEIRVADTGPGLSGEVAERVFEPFVTTKSHGLGLGLSISSGIVQAHGSRLTAESAPGRGAEFRFTLQSAPEDPHRVH